MKTHVETRLHILQS